MRPFSGLRGTGFNDRCNLDISGAVRSAQWALDSRPLVKAITLALPVRRTRVRSTYTSEDAQSQTDSREVDRQRLP
jgi:hypothetical protein